MISPWKSIPIGIDEAICIQFERKEIFCLQKNNEWQSLVRDNSVANPASNLKSFSIIRKKNKENIEYTDRIFSESSETVRLSPILFNKSCVVSPKNALKLEPYIQCSLFVWLPLCIQLVTENNAVLTEFVVQELSNTWFGDTEVGELCTSLNAEPETNINLEEIKKNPRYGYAIVPLHLKNESDQVLTIHNISVPQEMLTVFLFEDQIVTEQVNFIYESDGDMRLSIVKPALDALRNLPVLSPPRVSSHEKLVRRGLDFLKSIAGFQTR